MTLTPPDIHAAAAVDGGRGRGRRRCRTHNIEAQVAAGAFYLSLARFRSFDGRFEAPDKRRRGAKLQDFHLNVLLTAGASSVEHKQRGLDLFMLVVEVLTRKPRCCSENKRALKWIV